MSGAPSRHRGLGIVLAVLALVVASFATLDLRWDAFLAPGELAKIASFIASFFPPQADPAFLRRTLAATGETLAMSLLGTVLAAVGGMCLSLPASASGGPAARALHGTARLLLNALRSIPELVWAVLLLIAAGLGPFSGTLALALHTTGVLGRLFAEALENAPREPEHALTLSGAGPVAAFSYASLPIVLPQWVAYTLYRWEMNIRMAAVLGFVGGGGLGQLLYFHLSIFQQQQAMTVLLAMFVLVTLVDFASARLRRGLGPAYA